MRFSTNAGELASLLGHVKRSVPARTTIPILSHVEVVAGKDAVSVRGTNIDMECRGDVDAVVGEAGSAAVPGIAFQSIVASLRKSAPLEISLTGDRIVLVSGRSRYDLATLPLDDFPRVREPHPADRVTVTAASKDVGGQSGRGRERGILMEYYVRAAITKWEDIKIDYIPYPIGGFGKSAGVMFVYKTIEEFLNDFPGEEPLIMRTKDSDGIHNTVI